MGGELVRRSMEGGGILQDGGALCVVRRGGGP